MSMSLGRFRLGPLSIGNISVNFAIWPSSNKNQICPAHSPVVYSNLVLLEVGARAKILLLRWLGSLEQHCELYSMKEIFNQLSFDRIRQKWSFLIQSISSSKLLILFMLFKIVSWLQLMLLLYSELGNTFCTGFHWRHPQLKQSISTTWHSWRAKCFSKLHQLLTSLHLRV